MEIVKKKNSIAYYWQHLNVLDYIFLVSNLKEIPPSVSPEKKYIKKLRCNSTVLSKYNSAEKKVLIHAYMLKNGVGRYNIFY